MLRQLRRLILVSLVALLTASCSSGGGDDVASGGIGGTGISSGSISGFGSIFVNGFEFDLTGVPITIDDQPGTEADLQLGQIVTVTTDIGGDGTVTVTSVVFDDNLEGPISNDPQLDLDGLTKTFTVLGTTVIVDVDEAIFSTSVAGFDFDTIAKDDVVQVSGFFDDNGILQAKHIEKKGVLTPGLAVEAKGTIASLDAGAQTFMLRALTVHFNGGTDLTDVPGGLADGLFVEVKGTLQADGSVLATKAELEGVAQNAVAAAVEGIITGFNSNSDFFVSSGNGPVRVDAAGATFDPLGLVLTDDVEVEAEGPIVNGTLFATHIELRSALIKVESVVSADVQPDPDDPSNALKGMITLGFHGSQSVAVFVDESRTRMQNKVGALSALKLDDINIGDFLRVKARDDGTGKLIAKKIKRTNPRDVLVQAPVDASASSWNSVSGSGTIKFLLRDDLSFIVDVTTAFEDSDDVTVLTAEQFFDPSRLVTGALVKVKDKDNSLAPPDDGRGDGIVEVAEYED